MAYVPPHRKNQGVTSSSSSDETTKKGAADLFYSRESLCDYLGASLNTLVVSAGSPDSSEALAGIILHEGQHPDWPPKILCKSNLHVLGNIDSVNDGPESKDYPVFSEVPFRNRHSQRSFEFTGWWRISGFEYLEPQSKELIATFERKFNRRPSRRKAFGSDRYDLARTRTEEAWKDGLNRRWAIITLKKNLSRKDIPNFDVHRPQVDLKGLLKDMRYKILNQPTSSQSLELPSEEKRETNAVQLSNYENA